MKTNKYITIFHIDNDSDISEKNIYSCLLGKRKQAGADFNGGICQSEKIIVRIPTIEYLPINIGDKAVLGVYADEGVSSEALTIVEIDDNRRGNDCNWHFKVVLS